MKTAILLLALCLPNAGQCQVAYDDYAYQEAFSKAMVSLISKVLTNTVGDDKGAVKAPDLMWNSKETLPGFTTYVSKSPSRGTLGFLSTYDDAYDAHLPPEEAFKRFAKFVNTTLILIRARLPNARSTADSNDDGYWFSLPSSGELVNRSWIHSSLPVTVYVSRYLEGGSIDGKYAVWRYNIEIDRK